MRGRAMSLSPANGQANAGEPVKHTGSPSPTNGPAASSAAASTLSSAPRRELRAGSALLRLTSSRRWRVVCVGVGLAVRSLGRFGAGVVPFSYLGAQFFAQAPDVGRQLPNLCSHVRFVGR